MQLRMRNPTRAGVRACSILAAAICTAAPAAGTAPAQTITGEQKLWHRTTITFDGPPSAENASLNPFMDYRLDVELTAPSGRTFVVPGYYAADGEAGQSGARSGNKWRVDVLGTETGRWSYRARFERGENVAVAEKFGGGTTLSFHGRTGRFTIAGSDKTDRDFRAAGRGLLRNAGGHYLTFRGSGQAWIKGGPDIPENFLAYHEFDNTPARHRYAAHVGQWRPGDPTWRDGRGKGIIGALNYITSKGANSIYFLPMNLGGDGKDTFPFTSPRAGRNTRYDVSKLDQWERVFRHAQSLGIFLHFQLAETERGNETFFDNGRLGPQRKLFYRELVARFGHHPGLQWNLGEENEFGTKRRKAFAAFLKSVDPYDHPIASHTHTNRFGAYEPLLGSGDIDMTSFQTNHTGGRLSDDIETWRKKSAEAGAAWVVSIDEPQRIENDPDDAKRGYPSMRKRFLWPAYLSGAGGFEMYVQKDGGGHSLDQRIDDLRQMDAGLGYIGHALKFMRRLPVKRMAPADELVRGEDGAFGGAQVLARPGEVYAIYLPDTSNDDNPNTRGEGRGGGDGPPELDLRDCAGKEFRLRWYDPRTGEFAGGAARLGGGRWVSLGPSPDGYGEDSDWALEVRLVAAERD